MKKAVNKYIVIIVLLFGILLYAELNEPKPVDWRQTYSKDDKIPYGGYVLFDQLKKLNPNQLITVKDDHGPYEYIDDAEKIAGGKSNLIIIQSEGYLDRFEWEKLKHYAKRGNNVFVSSATFNSDVLEDMGLEIAAHESYYEAKDTLLIGRLVNPAFKKQAKYKQAINNRYVYFDIIKPKNIKILGVVQDSMPDFVVYTHGRGKIYLHANPSIFSNIHLLNGSNYKYTFGALSYLPSRPIIWDEYYKKKTEEEDIETGTPLAFILKQPAFRWGFYMLALGALLFLLLRGKRRQKAIPIIKPLANTSLEFTETIGRLYFNKGNHLDIAHKKIQYFTQFISSKYNLRFDERNPNFIEHLSEKSGVSFDEVKYLVWKIAEVKKQTRLSDEDLFKLNAKIDDFYKKAK